MHIYTKRSIDPQQYRAFIKIRTTLAQRINGAFTVQTPHGPVSCNDAYIALDSNGEPYPIERQEFERTYAPTGRKELTTGAPPND